MDSHDLNVSRGQQLHFAVDGSPMKGIIIESKQAFGPTASIIVEIESAVPEGAQLTMPNLNCGGCGAAHPVSRNGHTTIEISIPYGHIDLSTLGR